MIHERHTNPVIEKRLYELMVAKRWEDMEQYFLSLSNAEFRTSGHLLCDNLLLRFDGECFWEIFSRLSLFRPKAFLGTCLKAAVQLYQSGKITIDSRQFSDYAAETIKRGMKIDRDKCLFALIGILKEEREFSEVFNMFGVECGERRIPYLLHCTTQHAYYSLFVNLKHVQDEPDFIRKCCYALIRKGDRLSFNLASILCKYFGIHDVRGNFSLNLEPYKLSYMDSSQQAFESVLTSV